ncbi:hypothetical protein FDUTEX481_02140 [Tolypothrix sp. PCC 7601]|nr:hypothetical protein FDUTEX481_02140 [Tolypothrix sp. PCC 7601]
MKPALVQGFALTPSPSPTRRGEQEIQFPFSLREKGLGDEGASYLYNAQHPPRTGKMPIPQEFFSCAILVLSRQ